MPLRGPSFILPNIVAKRYVTVTTPATAAGLVPAGSEPSYLKTEEPTDAARVATLDPLYTRWKVDANGLSLLLSAVGVPNVNLFAAGKYRIVGHAARASSVSTLTLAPNSIDSSLNITGVVTNVDEAISSPDANYIAPTDPESQWIVMFGFPTPAATPKTGADMAAFVILVDRVGTPADTQGTPTVKAYLYESGLEVAFIGKRAITSESPGQVLTFRFNPSLLTTASGANLQLRLVFSPGDNLSSARLNAASFYYESAAATYLHDSGYLSSPFETFADHDDDGQPPTKSIGYWPDAPHATVQAFEFIVYDDQTDHLQESELDGLTGNGALLNAINDTPDGVVSAGLISAGPVLTFGTQNAGDGESPGIAGPVTPGGTIHIEQFGGVTVGGRNYGADAFRRIELPVELTITRDELITLQDRIAWRRGKAGAFYFALEPDIDASRQLFTSGWFTLKDLTQPARLHGTQYDAGGGEMLFVVTMILEQKL